MGALKIKYSEEDFQKASVKFRKELLRIPVLAVQDSLSYMTPYMDVRGTELVGTSRVRAEFSPSKAVKDTDLDLGLRPLTTYFGYLNGKFDPNTAIRTLLGHRAAQAMGDALVTTPTAKEVIALAAKDAGENLELHLFDAKRNDAGTETKDLFDGFDTITEAEIKDKKISKEVGNYIKLTEELTAENIVESLQSVMYAMSPQLRKQKCIMYVSQDILDLYNRGYKLESGGLSYVKEYEQTYLEGSNKMIEIKAFVGKAGSKYIHVTPKSNMLVGMDQMSDLENVNVKNYSPDDSLTLMMRIFWGTQIYSIDPRMLMVAELFSVDNAVVDNPVQNP